MQDLLALISFHNPWWLTRTIPAELNLPFRRPVYDAIFDYLKLDRVIILKGPRRTGKSTLLYQVMEGLLQKGVEAQRLFYFPFDDPDFVYSFNDLILQYEKSLGRELSKGPEVFCFFDEIQSLENWSSYLKKYADKKWPVKFIVSGSSASLIKQGAESLGGRTVEEIVLPFSFHEFLLYHLDADESALLAEVHRSFNLWAPEIPPQAGLIERKLAILFEQYLAIGGFPNLYGIKEPSLRKKLLQEDVVEKVIYRDLVKQYGVKRPEILERMFLYLVNQSSDMLNVTSIANSLKLSRDSAQEYIEYLKASYLVFIVQRFAPSAETTLRANPKAYAADCGLIEVFSDLAIGKRVESVVARHLISANPAYYHNRFEVDLIARRNNHLLPIEVKYKEHVKADDLAGLKAFEMKRPFSHAIVVTKNYSAKQDKIVFIPAHVFLALV